MKNRFCIFLIFFYIIGVNAQKHCVFTSISGTNSLSGNKVRNITQLPDGRMMITTEGMVNLYNGTTFSYLHYNQNHIFPLSAYSGFHHEYIDAHGFMWLKNRYTLMVVDINRERFVERPDSLLASWGVKEALKDFFMDKEKNLWLVTEKDDLLYWDTKSLKPVPFLHQVSSIGNEPNNDQLYDLGVFNQKLYLFFRSGLLVCFDIPSRKEVYRQQSQNAFSSGYYGTTSYVVQGKDRFFQLCNGNRGGSMLSYDVNQRKWKTVLQEDYWLNYLSIDKDGSIWISCLKGLWNIDASLTKKQYIPSLKLVDGRNIDTEVSTLYNDAQGGMWVGTVNRGLLYYHPERFRFQNIGSSLFPLKESKTINVTCFAEMQDGNIIVGTKEGLFSYSPQTGEIRSYNNELSSVYCHFLLRDSQQRIWLSSGGQGLYCMLPDGKTKYYPLPGIAVYSIAETPQHTLVLGTNRHFGYFEPSTGTFEEQADTKNLNWHSVYQLACLGKDSIAGITEKGWFIFDKMKGKYTDIPLLHTCQTIGVEKGKRVWIGLQDGLYVYDLQSRNEHCFYTDDGLVNNYVQSVYQSRTGALWISTSNGISRVLPEQLSFGQNGKQTQISFANFNQFDGVITDEFCDRSVFEASDGTLYWGGINGFNKLLSRWQTENKLHSIPLFIGFELFNKRLDEGEAFDSRIILEQPITLTKEIVLEYNQNFFSLDFSALNYVNPTQTYYRYQLSGVDQVEREIHSSDGMGRATYTDLAPGTYIFRVQVADNSKQWSGQYAEMKIVVKAPFWKTPLAYLFYVLVITGSIVAAIRHYLQQKRKRMLQEQKEKLDEMKSTFLRNMNEELTEPIQQIMTPLSILLKHTDEGRTKQQLEEIQSNVTDLKGLVNQLSEGVLSPVAVDEQELNLETLLYNMRRLLELQQERKEQGAIAADESFMSTVDETFIRRALQFVEEHLDHPDYSVEMLSKDMGMDRTGLYRKLVSILGKTPTTFIRSIRLKRAAQLLEEGYSVTEVTDRVGFSTSSYLSKCFQEEFGMKPLQYVNSLKKGNK